MAAQFLETVKEVIHIDVGREDWYERFTGRCIADATLQEQNELCDVSARRFRGYSDGGRRWGFPCLLGQEVGRRTWSPC